MATPYVYKYEDALVRQVGKMRHGKRVPADCKLDRKYRRIYVKDGIIACIKQMRVDGFAFTDALKLVDGARFNAAFPRERQRHF